MADTQQLGLSFQLPQRKIYPVRELVSAVRTQLERSFTDVYVEGEISNYRPAESGHLYFTLKDGGAQLRVVMWRTQARLLRFRPENGQQIIVRGRLTVYDERGDLQLQAEHLEPKGAGGLQIAFEQLKAKLAAEGLFDAARRKLLPALPRRIGVVTSPRGAALQDILNILRRRHESIGILVYPAQVQGEGAALEVAAGVRYFNRQKNVDVIIVTRGGGSFEDLFAFNDEGLARVIAASVLPVVSAVGHETDFTICDFVSDLRAPTPSAAAELVAQSKRELSGRLLSLHKQLTQFMNYKLLRAHNTLNRLAQDAAFARMRDSIGRRQQHVDELTYRLEQAHRKWLRSLGRRLETLDGRLRHHDLRVRLSAMRRELDARTTELQSALARGLLVRATRLDRLSEALARSSQAVMLARRSRLEQLHTNMQALSPRAILDRGYALVFDSEGNLVRQAGQLSPGSMIRAQLARGRFTAEVEEVESEESAE